MENPVGSPSPCSGRFPGLHPVVTNACSTMVAPMIESLVIMIDAEEPGVTDGDIVPSVEPAAP